MPRSTYSTASRDRYRTAVTVGTGLGVVGALAGSGWLAGAAAARFEAADSADQAAPPVDAPRTRTARRDDRPLRQRPIRTRVTVRYVSAVGAATVGAGGTVTRVDSGSHRVRGVQRVGRLRWVGLLGRRYVVGTRSGTGTATRAPHADERLMSAQERFPALGTTACVTVRAARDLGPAVAATRRVVADVDATCSRFRADSDLARVNAAPGRWTRVDPLLVAAVEVAVEAARQTGGLVNPLLGRPLVELGYDRDLAAVHLVADDGRAGAATTPVPLPQAWRAIRTDPDGGLRIPEGTALDLGATAKAWAADLAAAVLLEHLHASAVVGLGGDLRVVGRVGDWPVEVSEHPDEPVAERVRLGSGGMATSSTMVRRWTRHGVRRHHLLDPRTGLPVAPCWRTVTATGPTCTAANVASTAAVVLGPAAPTWLAAHGVDARLVGVDGTVSRVGAWPAEAGRSVA